VHGGDQFPFFHLGGETDHLIPLKGL
jgi:hypothetical protein